MVLVDPLVGSDGIRPLIHGIFAEIQIRHAKRVFPALNPQRGAGPQAQGPMIMLCNATSEKIKESYG